MPKDIYPSTIEAFFNQWPGGKQVYLSTSLEYDSPSAPTTLAEAGYRALFKNALLRNGGDTVPPETNFCGLGVSLAKSEVENKKLKKQVDELIKKGLKDSERQMRWYNDLLSQVHSLEHHADILDTSKRDLTRQLEVTTRKSESDRAEAKKKLAEASEQLMLEARARHDLEVRLRKAEDDLEASKQLVHSARLQQEKSNDEASRLSDELKATAAEVLRLQRTLAAERRSSADMESTLYETSQKNVDLVSELSEKKDQLGELETERGANRGMFSSPKTPRTAKRLRSMSLFGFHVRGGSPRWRDRGEGGSSNTE
ncbi:hypothetical protein NLI96_g1033 [Meripilus lineatus]|uniref:Uncharacterized protein n=1 Tax=Meripilus lineatus TaxID=2056292 RepID=A0AAD5VB14_9APHY|nr:hypothetical protein NLI96_g1033 [Physisporinus lineatus]